MWWIRQAILQAIAEQGPAVRLPVNKRNLLKEISETARQLGQGRGDEPDWREVARAVVRAEGDETEGKQDAETGHAQLRLYARDGAERPMFEGAAAVDADSGTGIRPSFEPG